MIWGNFKLFAFGTFTHIHFNNVCLQRSCIFFHAHPLFYDTTPFL